MSAVADLARKVKRRLAASPDREHEMALNRLVGCAAVILFNALRPPAGMAPLWAMLTTLAYFAVGWALLAHLLLRPRQTALRRQVALAFDVAAVTLEMQVGGAATAWLYPGYLWIVFGNGFRFGPRQLLVAMLASLAGLSFVITETPFWTAQPATCAGMLVGILIIPLYTFSLLRKLSRAREQAEAANRAKSLFLATVSHELRTPLNAIIGFGALLADERLDPEQQEMTQTILSSGRSLLSLIDSILNLSRIESGQMPVSVVEFDLLEMLEELRRMVLAQAQEKRLHVALHVSVRTPATLRGDVARLREILLNLLSNAVKFTESGSIVLAADVAADVADDARDVVPGDAVAGQASGQTSGEASGEAGGVGAEPAGAVRLRFEVEDTGIGIAPEAQSRIFETFTQADETIASRYGGTGLGLSITRQLVELLGGAITVDSQPGRGTLVRVELSMQAAPAAAAPLESAPRAGARCLVVRDDAGLAGPIVRRLQALGAEVEAGIRPDAAAALGFSAGDGLPASTMVAVIRHSCETPRLSFGALLANDALRFFDVTDEAAPPAASRQQRRRLATRVPAAADDAELMRALRICGGVAGDRGGSGEPAWAGRSRRSALVLVADDNRVNQKVLTRILEHAGHRVILAGDGDEMLDVLDLTQIDLVIADVNMPNTNGIEATQILRMTRPAQPRVPVVGVTADATPETRASCLAAGMDVCLLKPVEPSALIEAVDRLLGETAGSDAGDLARSPAAPAANVVRSIASHPRFRQATVPIIDQAMLEELRALGGEAFVAEIVSDFLAETEELMECLRVAAAAADAESFRSWAHAICSGAANVGARQLCELAGPWQAVSAEQLRRHGEDYASEIAAHLIKLKRSLAVAAPGAGPVVARPR
jgi:two-component system sensor histidine kinase RpfC